MAAPPSPPERIAASASPIQSDQVETIRLTLSVALLTQPNERGNLRLEAPHGLIDEERFFALRYYIHGRARRAVVQALRVTEAGTGRDVVTVRLISDTAVREREARRERAGFAARARRVSSDPVEAARAFAVELADFSRTGVGFESSLPLALGDRLAVDLPDGDGETAEIEVVRYDAHAPVPYGARFVDREQAGPFFTRMLDAVWREPVEAPAQLRVEQQAGDVVAERGAGMRARRSS